MSAATSPKSGRTSLKKGALLNWTSLGVYFVSAFVVTPIIIRKLGNGGFGTWALIQSFAGYYGLVNMGLASALLRSVTHDIAKQETASLQTTVSTAVRFYALSGGSILILAGVLSFPAAGFFNVPPSDKVLFALTVVLAASAIITDFFSSITNAFLNASERFDWLNGLNIGRQLLQTTGTLLVLSFKPSIAGIAAVMVVTSLGALAISTSCAKRLHPEVRFLMPGFSRARLKELLAYGGGTVLLTVSNIVRLRLGNLVIAKMSGVAAVAGYSIAVNLVTNLSSVISSSMGVLNPRFTRLAAQAREGELFQLYRSALFVSAAMSFGVGTAMLLFGETFIHLWVGKNLPESVPILKVLVLAYMVALAQSPGWNLMFAISKHHFMARVSLVEAGINIALGLWLSHRYGSIGFAWATSSTMLVSKLFIQPPYSARIGGLTTAQYLEPMALPLAVAVLLWLTAYWGSLDLYLREHGVGFFLMAAAVYGLAYGGLLVLLVRRKDYLPSFVAKYVSRA